MANNKDTSNKRSEAKSLLLEDYRYLADSFWKNEQVGGNPGRPESAV